MNPAALHRGRGVVHRRPHERVAEAHQRFDLTSPLASTSIAASSHASPAIVLGCTPNQGRITLLLDGGEKDRRLRIIAQGTKACRKDGRQVWPDRQWVRQGCRTSQLLFGQRLRQLDERQRIATGRRDDVVGDDIVEHAASHRHDESTRVGCGQPIHMEAWQSFELDSVVVRSRAATSIANLSARSRRATKAITVADSSSNHSRRRRPPTPAELERPRRAGSAPPTRR